MPTAAGEDGLPLYLQTAGQDALRRLGIGQRLRLVTGNALEQMEILANATGPFDLISISNIPDWMSDAQFGEAVLQARGCLRPGGALLARTATGSPMIQAVMRMHMQVDEDLVARLPAIERGPWFRMLAAGFRSDE